MHDFVSAVGYQVEKVHTAPIRWILDSRNEKVSLSERFGLLSKIYQLCGRSIDFSLTDVVTITCYPEYSIGRTRKIDLVVEIKIRNRTSKFLVMEMKVDSIPSSEQLEGTRVDFEQRIPNADSLFLLVLLGASQVCIPLKLHGFSVMVVDDVLRTFTPLSTHHYLYTDWISALEGEEQRQKEILTHLKRANSILGDRQYWTEKGYRLERPLFYYLYDKLRKASNRPPEVWEIANGGNNAVMNWADGWLKTVRDDKPVEFYWEFNDEDFALKAKLDHNVSNRLTEASFKQLKHDVSKICRLTTLGAPTTYRGKNGVPGEYNSIYKWRFDFTDDFQDVIAVVDNIIDCVHPVLKQTYEKKS